MAITWHDIKLKTMQKMFAINNGSTRLPTDSMGKDYLNAMPGAANEALQMLATAGKFIIKSVDIAHIPVKSLIAGSERIRSIERGTITYEADQAYSMYYECKGKGTMTVAIGDYEPIETDFDDTDSLGYVPHKLLLDRHNVSDTTFDNTKPINKIVAGESVSIVIAKLTDCSSARIISETTTSPNGTFTVVNVGTDYHIVYTDLLDSPGISSAYSVRYAYTPIGGTERTVTIATHELYSIPAIKSGKAVVSFTSDYPLSLMNVALYAADYENEEDIPPYSQFIRYDLSELAPDYYMVDPEQVIYEGNYDYEWKRYKATSKWFQE